MALEQTKYTKAWRRAAIIDAMGGGLCHLHGAYYGHGKYNLRDCPFCDIEEFFKKKELKAKEP